MTTRFQGLAVTVMLSACVAGTAYGQLTFTTLDHPLAGQGGTVAYDLDGGRIVGTYLDANGASHGFVFDGATWSTLDHPDAVLPRGTAAFGTSDGLICGTYVDAAGRTLGFIYDGVNWTTLQRPPIGIAPVDTFARGIAGDQVVGYSVELLVARGFVYTGGVFSDVLVPAAVGTFPDDTDGARVVGHFEDLIGTHGFITTGGVPVVLDHPLGALGTDLTGVDAGNIVGNYIRLPDATSHGFLFDGTQFVPIDIPGATDTTVNGIDGVQVVGSYLDAAGRTHGFVATIPEPAGACTTAGFALMTLTRRRGRRRLNRSGVTSCPVPGVARVAPHCKTSTDGATAPANCVILSAV